MGRKNRTVRIRWKVNGAEATIPEFQVPIVKRLFGIEVLDSKPSIEPAELSKNKGGK